MASAAERDSVASEYATDYALTFEAGVPALAAALGDGLAVRDAVVELHLRLLDQCAPPPGAGRCGASTPRCASRATRSTLGPPPTS
jgi:triphosphoribosyl-dephospho-CoA synthase